MVVGSLGGQLAWIQAFLKFQKPLDLRGSIPCWVGGGPGSKHWGSFKATSILPAVMEQAAAHPGSPSRGGPQRSAGG